MFGRPLALFTNSSSTRPVSKIEDLQRMLGATPQNVFRSIAGNVNIQNRCLSLGPSSNQKMKVTSRGFVLVGCYCFADFNCVLLQHALQCKWCTNCPEGACIGTAVSCTSEHDCRINQREIFLSSNCTETSCEASDCSKCTASGKCMWTRQFKRTGTDGGGVVEIGTMFICYGYNNVFANSTQSSFQVKRGAS